MTESYLNTYVFCAILKSAVCMVILYKLYDVCSRINAVVFLYHDFAYNVV